MPIYEYKCEECKIAFEADVPMQYRDSVICMCGNDAARTISFRGVVYRPTTPAKGK